MKNIIITLVLSTLIVSCGLSPEEQKALEALKSREYSLKLDVAADRLSKDFWFEEFEKETDTYTKSLYATEYEVAMYKLETTEAELAEVQFQISQIK